MKIKSLLLYCILICQTSLGQPGSIATKDGVLYYHSYGQGEPVLIINGGPGMNSEGFQSLANKISTNQFRAIIYDQRGTGRSTLHHLSASTMTMDLMREDIETLRKHLQIERWAILGHSFGGVLASYYAAKYPDKITKLILSSSGGVNLDFLKYINASIQSNLTKQQRDSLDYWVKKMNNGDSSLFAKTQRANWLAPAYVYNKKIAAQIAQRLTKVDLYINQLIFADLRKINYDCSNLLKKVMAPVLIIQGEQDIIKAETAHTSAASFSNVSIKFIPKCGHYGWLEQPNTYMEGIIRFLRWK